MAKFTNGQRFTSDVTLIISWTNTVSLLFKFFHFEINHAFVVSKKSPKELESRASLIKGYQ